jgi:hypothetical protein
LNANAKTTQTIGENQNQRGIRRAELDVCDEIDLLIRLQ